MKRTRLLGVAICVAALVPGFTLGIMSSGSAGATPAVAAKTVDPPVADVNPFLRPHPVLVRQAAPSAPTRVTVASGDTLSSIARARYGSTSLWPALWWVNKARVHNPNALQVGQVLKLSAWHPQAGWLVRAAMHAIPAPPRPHVTVLSYSGPRTYHRAGPSGTYHGTGGMEQCIIAAESGGNSQVMNSSGHYGLYQFSYSTWVASGGSPSSFGHASVAEQQAAFHTAVAARGYSDWTPYDPC